MRTMLDWLELAGEGEGGDEALEALSEQADKLEELLTSTEMTILLSGEADRMNAIMDIHPGAGGDGSAGLGRNAGAHVSALGG